MYCFFYKLTLTFFSLFTCWRQDKLCNCLPNHVNMFYYCLHVDVWQLSLWWLRGKAAQPTCVIIFYVYIINVSCYFLHFHFILFCYYLHFDVLLLCKHLTAFLVVVARQKQGGRASERAAASAAPESESAPEEEGAAVHQILLRGGEQNRLLKTHHFLLKVREHRSEALKQLHWCVQRWDIDKDWDKDSKTSNTAILNVQNEDHGQLAAGGQRHQGLELGGAHQRLRLGRAVTSWKQEHTTSTTTYTTQDQRLQ